MLLHRWADICHLPYDEVRARYKSYYKLLETNQKTLDDFVKFLNQPSPQPFIAALESVYTQENFLNNLNLPVLNLIREFRKTNRVGFLSNAENFFYPYIQQKLEPEFDFSYSSWQLGLEKPDPQIYLQVLKLQNLSPEEVVFIDDNTDNVTSAQTLGIHTILFESIQRLLDELKKINSLKTEIWQTEIYFTNPIGMYHVIGFLHTGHVTGGVFPTYIFPQFTHFHSNSTSES